MSFDDNEHIIDCLMSQLARRRRWAEIRPNFTMKVLEYQKKFRSRLLIRFNEKSLKQKMVSNLLNSLKISSKIKLTVDVDPVNFA